MGGTMGADMTSAMGLWMLLSVVVVLAALGVLIAAGVWLVRRVGMTGPGPADLSLDPTRILKRRYAAGEIDENEYERRLTRLNR